MLKHLYVFGNNLSEWGSKFAGHPFAIFGTAGFCSVWFLVGGAAGVSVLSIILSILAITLTQMVLNQQRRSEQALHLKIDELVYAMKGARDEIAGIETKSVEELEALRRTVDAAEDVLEERSAA